MKEELKKKYDAKSIGDLEASVERSFTLSKEHQREMYVCLEYLKMTSRFRENTRYKKATFWTYLSDRFTIREGTYRENVRAFCNYPDFAVEYGVGLVTHIGNACGSKKIAKVISEITKEEQVRKKPLNRANISGIISKHATVKIEKKITDWHAMYEHEKLAHETTKQSLKLALAQVKELTEQVEKLKVTAETVTSIRNLFDRNGVAQHTTM